MQYQEVVHKDSISLRHYLNRNQRKSRLMRNNPGSNRRGCWRELETETETTAKRTGNDDEQNEENKNYANASESSTKASN